LRILAAYGQFGQPLHSRTIQAYDPQVRKFPGDLLGHFRQTFRNATQTGLPGFQGQIGQVDIHRQSRHIANEKINGGSPFEGEAAVRGDDREELQEQPCLLEKEAIPGDHALATVPTGHTRSKWFDLFLFCPARLVI